MGIAERLAARLARAGVNAHVVGEVTQEASGVLFARGLSRADSLEQAVAIQRDALRAARTLANRQGPRLLVTLQDTGGEFGLSGRAAERAWTGGLAGLAKTAAAEWPDASVKAIDVACAGASADTAADRIVAELLLGGRDVEVALSRTGGRAVVHHQPAAYGVAGPADPARLREGSVIVVSGGARGVTAASLSSLCKYRPRLALLGRTALVEELADTRSAATDADIRRALLARAKAAGVTPQPKQLAQEAKLILDCREIKGNVAALQQAGAEVTYHAVDIRNGDAVRSVVDEVRRR
jgi:hypothetical protein